MKVLLIPSATLIPKEMRKELGEIPTILYPLNGTPILDHLYQQYKSQVDRMYIIVYKKKNLIIDYIMTKNFDINVIELDRMLDLGYTIMNGLENIPDIENIKELYINFADTLIFDKLQLLTTDSSFCSSAMLNETWTFFETDIQNHITNIYDKRENLNIDPAPNLPFFVGCFYFTHINALKKLLKDALEQKFDLTKCDSFYSALKNYSSYYKMDFLHTDTWFDVGHSENYLKAKTGVQARVFNSIEIDESRGILKKTSLNKDKFIDEINWYLKIPNKLQYLIPRIYDFSVSRDNPYISMEYYGYNTLHEVFLYGDLPLYKWQSIFEKIKFVLNDMRNYKVKSSPEMKESLKNMYITKTLNRLEVLKKDTAFATFFNNDIIINGINYHSLEYYIKNLPQIINDELLKNTNIEFNIIHGDLCFSNILLEENHGFVRVIDPRGKFGSFDIYGDPRYEMAKLLHSIEGKYDFIIEDMFKVSIDDNKINFLLPDRTDKITSVFYEVFKEQLSDVIPIRLIESTLFLSMIPLHNDYITRQYAMLATGVMQLERILKERKYD